jgi:ubiquitin-protein ligase
MPARAAGRTLARIRARPGRTVAEALMDKRIGLGDARSRAMAAAASAAPSSHLLKRLHREILAMRKEDRADTGVKVRVPASLTEPWTAYIRGPVGPHYEGSAYAVQVTVGRGYPHAPPTVMFLNRCWHPNIGVNGHVCVDILKSQWAASLTILKLLQSVQSLLDDPDPTSPLNGAAADMVRNAKSTGDASLYRRTIQAACTERYVLSEQDCRFEAGKPVLVEDE